MTKVNKEKHDETNSFDHSSNSLFGEIYTLESAYSKQGGYGMAQIISVICLSVIRNSGNPFFNVFSMLTMEQRYFC